MSELGRDEVVDAPVDEGEDEVLVVLVAVLSVVLGGEEVAAELHPPRHARPSASVAIVVGLEKKLRDMRLPLRLQDRRVWGEGSHAVAPQAIAPGPAAPVATSSSS